MADQTNLVVMDNDDNPEAVLENAYDIIVTGEINGIDTLEFNLPFRDGKRQYLENEKQLSVGGDTYRIRTITDEKNEQGTAITSVYAEAAFYDLGFYVKKTERTFNADTADVPIVYALKDTGWTLETVNVRTKRTWTSTEKNALAVLRKVQDLHGGDLIFDNRNRTVSLLTFSGTDSCALFCYRKNMKSIKRVIDTQSLITRLYAYGKDGMTFASINDGKEYVEDTTYTDEIRISTLDCSNFTNPYQMLEYATMRLADYAAPRVSYVLNAMRRHILRRRTGFTARSCAAIRISATSSAFPSRQGSSAGNTTCANRGTPCSNCRPRSGSSATPPRSGTRQPTRSPGRTSSTARK